MDIQNSEIKQEEDVIWTELGGTAEVEEIAPDLDNIERTQIEEPGKTNFKLWSWRLSEVNYYILGAELSSNSKDAHEEPFSNLTTFNDLKQFAVENWDVEMNPTNLGIVLKLESVHVNQTDYYTKIADKLRLKHKISDQLPWKSESYDCPVKDVGVCSSKTLPSIMKTSRKAHKHPIIKNR